MAAIKVLTMQPANLHQLRSAEQEWQIMASLTHPHCVKVLTFYTARVMQKSSCLDLFRCVHPCCVNLSSRLAWVFRDVAVRTGADADRRCPCTLLPMQDGQQRLP